MLEPQQQERLLSDSVKRCVIALSGGADSVALLHSVVGLGLARPVVAIHINHGLQAEADGWQLFCEKFCASLGVKLTCVVVDVATKGSMEDNARKARYEAFTNFLESGDLLLLAHHGNDQLETIMLNLMRGSEAYGVRGMPPERDIGKAFLYRPLLKLWREDVLDYCRTQSLEWIEDDSNRDESLDRNYLRHSILPGLARRFPAMGSALLNALDRDEEASQLMTDYSEIDLKMAMSPEGGIRLDVVREFSELRVVNMLRVLLSQKEVPYPSGKQLRECVRIMTGARDDAMPVLKWSEYEFARHKGCVYLLHNLTSQEPETGWQNVSLPRRDVVKINGGILTMELVKGKGIRVKDNLEMQSRIGGETIRLKQTRTLKKLLQEREVPTWLRSHLPLVFDGDELVAVPGISSWNTEGVYAESRKVAADESGWVFTFDIRDRV